MSRPNVTRKAIACFFLFSPFMFAAPSRRALVIGNDSYSGNALKNARNDARSIAKGLGDLGYVTTLALDVNRKMMEEVVNQFADSVAPGDVAIIYYAGHGVEVEGRNYLVPIDFSVSGQEEIRNQGYSLSQLLAKLTEHGVITQIVVLDSCRNNPFSGTRSLGGGWASIGASAGTFVAFGTAPGSTSSDDPAEDHGLFTKALLNNLGSHTNVEQMFQQVRMEVIKDSHGSQIPWTSSSLIGTFHVDPHLDADALSLPDLSSTTLNPVREVKARSYTQRSDRDPGTQVSTTGESVNQDQMISEAVAQARSLHFTQAMSILRVVLAADPRCGVALRLMGLALQLSGRTVEALGVLDRAIEVNPTDPLAYSYRCLIGIESTVLEADCRKALTLRSDLPEAHVGLAMSLQQQGKLDEAVQEAGRSIVLDPDIVSGRSLRGDINSFRNRLDKAKEDYEKATTVTLGEVNRSLGKLSGGESKTSISSLDLLVP